VKAGLVLWVRRCVFVGFLETQKRQKELREDEDNPEGVKMGKKASPRVFKGIRTRVLGVRKRFPPKPSETHHFLFLEMTNSSFETG
jgi:hypothetical protein